MQFVFIVNNVAGDSHAKEKLHKELKSVNYVIDYDVYETNGKSDATKVVEEYCKSKREICFVACGGDGTVNEVASALVNKENKYLAVMPYGSGNDFIKYFCDRDFYSIKKLITGEKNGKNPYGKGIRHAVFYGRFNKINICVDGEKITKKRMLLSSFANAKYVGGKYLCAPNAVIDDGLMEVCLFHSTTLFNFLTKIKKYEKGLHLTDKKCRKLCVYRRAKTAEITAEKEIEIVIDGETLKSKHFLVEVLPKAINLLLPSL